MVEGQRGETAPISIMQFFCCVVRLSSHKSPNIYTTTQYKNLYFLKLINHSKNKKISITLYKTIGLATLQQYYSNIITEVL